MIRYINLYSIYESVVIHSYLDCLAETHGIYEQETIDAFKLIQLIRIGKEWTEHVNPELTCK